MFDIKEVFEEKVLTVIIISNTRIKQRVCRVLIRHNTA